MLLIVLIAAGVATLAHIAPFPFLIDAAAGGRSVWRMPTNGARSIYLTFDDGPNPTATPQLLDLLREKNARATFFLIDGYVNESTAPIVRRMFDEGHAVALHSGDRWLFLRSPGRLAKTLLDAASRIEALTGRPPCRLFRPHAGWRSLAMYAGAARANYKIAGWSWKTWDKVLFRKRTAARVASQIAANAAPGKIVVLHDGHHRDPRADRRYAAEATGIVIDELRARGYEFRTMCE